MTTDFVAVRGKRQLSEEEFKAHLALCTRLENIGVFLGAGASVGVGGHTMQRLWSEFTASKTNSVQWLGDEMFLEAPYGSSEDVEALLDRLELAGREWERISDLTKLEELCFHRAELQRAVLRAALLQEDFWIAPEKVAGTTTMDSHVLLLARLVANRQPGQSAPWLFTTNYDLALEWAAETLGLHLSNGFSGVHLRRFNPPSYDLAYTHATARGEARFGTYHVYLAKLHGSLSWRVLPDGSVTEVASSAQWQAVQDFLRGKTAEWPGLMIFPGAAKFVQTTGFVYGEVIRRLTEFASRPNTALIVSGYSFADDHLNRILLSALQNPTMQMIVYMPEMLDRLVIDGFPSPPRPFPAGRAAQHLLGRGLPQITVVGHGGRAYFDKFVSDLPDAALLDDLASDAWQMRRLIQQMEGRPASGGSSQFSAGGLS